MSSNKVVITIGTVIFLFIAWVMYQNLVVIPQSEIDRKTQEIQDKRLDEIMAQKIREDNYNQCIADAYESYSADWEKKCIVENKGTDCTLPGYSAEVFNDRLEKNKDICVKMYQ